MFPNLALKTFFYGDAVMKKGAERVCSEILTHTYKQQRKRKKVRQILARRIKKRFLLKRNMVEYCYSYLLPVKYEPFSHVIPILIFLEEFTAWKRRQHYSMLLALPVLVNSSLATFDSRCWRTQEP